MRTTAEVQGIEVHTVILALLLVFQASNNIPIDLLCIGLSPEICMIRMASGH